MPFTEHVETNVITILIVSTFAISHSGAVSGTVLAGPSVPPVVTVHMIGASVQNLKEMRRVWTPGVIKLISAKATVREKLIHV